MISTDRLGGKEAWRTVSQIPQKCKETSNLMWLSIVWFISVLFVYWNLFCTIANLRIKWVTETKNVSVLFYNNLKSSFLNDLHIWLWGFFTFLVALTHGATGGCRCGSSDQQRAMRQHANPSVWRRKLDDGCCHRCHVKRRPRHSKLMIGFHHSRTAAAAQWDGHVALAVFNSWQDQRLRARHRRASLGVCWPSRASLLMLSLGSESRSTAAAAAAG